MFGVDAYPGVHEKAAALLQSHVPGRAEDELFDLVIAVATRALDEVQAIALRLGRIVG